MSRLIEEIRSRPVLWNTALEIYRDAVLREKAWEEIAEALGEESK
jgi:hypothetical protein